jgi:hypothetical protein
VSVSSQMRGETPAEIPIIATRATEPSDAGAYPAGTPQARGKINGGNRASGRLRPIVYGPTVPVPCPP